jgi:hypothetical protein
MNSIHRIADFGGNVYRLDVPDLAGSYTMLLVEK